MPALENQRHERFAQELAKGKTATEAYVLAGYKPNMRGNGRMVKEAARLITESRRPVIYAGGDILKAHAAASGEISRRWPTSGVRVGRRLRCRCRARPACPRLRC